VVSHWHKVSVLSRHTTDLAFHLILFTHCNRLLKSDTSLVQIFGIQHLQKQNKNHKHITAVIKTTAYTHSSNNNNYTLNTANKQLIIHSLRLVKHHIKSTIYAKIKHYKLILRKQTIQFQDTLTVHHFINHKLNSRQTHKENICSALVFKRCWLADAKVIKFKLATLTYKTLFHSACLPSVPSELPHTHTFSTLCKN